MGSVWLLGSRRDTREHVYIEASVGRPDRINPLLAFQNDVDADLCALIFSGLTRIAADGQVMPDLAERWEAGDDGRSFRFYLRKNAFWHDGKRVTTEDVLFTLDLLRQAAAAEEPGIAPFWRDVRVVSEGDDTVLITLPAPFAQFPSYATIGILPRHGLKETSLEAVKASPFNRAPVGTGPFMLAALTDSRAVLQPNPRYWFGKPHLNRIEFRFYPNTEAQILALRRGEADGALIVGRSPAAVQSALASERRFAIVPLPYNATETLYFNVLSQQLTDLDVRQALALAVDRDALAALGDSGAVAATGFGAAGIWSTAWKGRPTDPGKAQALLEAAGWQSDESGRRMKDGQPLRVVLTTTADPDHTIRAQAIVDRWRAIGVDARLEPLSPTLLIREALGPRRFDALLLGRSDPAEPDLFSIWHSSQTGPDGQNIANLADSTLDKLAEEARQQPDAEQRREIYRRAALILQRQMPALPLVHPVDVYVIDRRLQGVSVKVLFTMSSRFTDVHQWRFQHERW